MSALPSEADISVAKIVLDVQGKKIRDLDTRIDGVIVDGELDRTILGASTLTLTLNDPQRELLQMGVFNPTKTPTRVVLDGVSWRLVKVSKTAETLTLTFEDDVVSLLRQFRKPRKAARGQVTRAQFALSLVREAGRTIPFVCPSLNVVQPITKSKQQPGIVRKKTSAAKGIPIDAPLTVKGAKATTAQKKMGERVLTVADSAGAPDKARLALMEACIIESLLSNPSGGDATSSGILQLLASTAKGLHLNPRDPEACCFAFLQRGFTGRGGANQLALQNPQWSAGRVAQAVQGSAYPTRYDGVRAEAQHWLDVFKGVTQTTTIDVTKTKALPFQFRRGGPNGVKEDSWACLQRLASEVNWRCFVVAGAVWFVSDNDLMTAKPSGHLSELVEGIETIDFDVDSGKQVDQATITARAARWYAAPGSVIVLEECGPADGRWLVEEIRRGLFDAQTTITLQRPGNPLAEPAPTFQVTQQSIQLTSKASETLGTAGSSGDQRLDVIKKACREMTAKRFPYVWGGGHPKGPGVPTGGPPVGYDCSGSTCAILSAANLGFKFGGTTATSGQIAAGWGAPGKGQHITVWASKIHVWMEIDGRHFGTGDWGKGWGGPGWNPRMHPTDGFTPRHWPGL